MSETKETHVHVREDGTVIEHSHGPHGHHHSHEQTKAVLNRLSRAIGHLESIKRMVEDGRDCSEVLIQLSAVKSAINNTGKIILQVLWPNHMTEKEMWELAGKNHFRKIIPYHSTDRKPESDVFSL